MKKNILIVILSLLTSCAFSYARPSAGFSSCRFSSRQAAMDFTRALSGTLEYAAKLSPDDLSQLASCSLQKGDPSYDVD